jgi:HK97 family phage major capsid protein
MMSIETLRGKQLRIQKVARTKIRELNDTTPAADAAKIESDFEVLMREHDTLDSQIEDRAARLKEQPDPRRPSLGGTSPGIDVGADDEEEGFSLAPYRRMKTWAQARSDDEYQGLTLGKYLRSMIVGAKTDVERRALAGGTDSAGGYTTPTILSATLIDMLRASSVLNAAGAVTVPLSSDSNVIAAVATDPVPVWRAENAAVAESDPTFRSVTLTPRSLAVLTRVSFELMQDSLNLEQQLPLILATALAKELDRVGLLGTGTAPQPRGIANTVGIGTLAHGAALTNYAQMGAARTAVLTANAGMPTAYIMHPRDEGKFVGLVDSTGQPLIGPKPITDIPFLTTSAIPVNGGAGTDESTIFCGNFAEMLLGVRTDIRIEVLKERYMDNLQFGLVAHLRADVAVQHAGAFFTITGVQG